MKTIKFFAVAAVAVMTVVSGGPKKSSYDQLVESTKKDKEVKALEASKATTDSISYLLGVNYALMLEGQGFFDSANEINIEELKKGFADAFKNGSPSNPYGLDEAWAKNFKISPYDMNQIFNTYLMNRRAYKATFNTKLGQKFLEQNKKKSNVKVTESGLQYVLHVEGEGAKVMPEDRVLVNYKGTLLDGTQFDANDSTEFYANQVIKGWTEGLGLLGKGGKATLYIPSELAYGERGAGRDIAPNSTLIFEVEVLDIIRPEVADSAAVEIVEVE